MTEQNKFAGEAGAEEMLRRRSRLTCAQCERMLLDAADGTLLDEDRAQFEAHIASCDACQRLYTEAERGAAWMGMLREMPPAPPTNIVDAILARTTGDAAEVAAAMAHLQADRLLGNTAGAKVIPFHIPERTRVQRMMHAVVQPRFAMTAAMAFFSIALTLNLAGVRISSLHASDLKPTAIKHSFWAMNGRVVRYYDNLRVVYELESRVREMQRESETDTPAKRGIQDAEPARSKPSGEPKSESPIPVQRSTTRDRADRTTHFQQTVAGVCGSTTANARERA